MKSFLQKLKKNQLRYIILKFFIVLLLYHLFFNTISIAKQSTGINAFDKKQENYFLKGQLLIDEGDFEQAAVILEKAITEVDSSKDIFLYLDICFALVDSYQNLGFLTKAKKILYDALPVALKSQDRYRNIQYLNKLGIVHYSLGELEPAFKYFKKANEEAQKTKHPIIYANVMNNIANCLFNEKEYEDAMAIYYACLDLIEETEDYEMKSLILLNLFQLELQFSNFTDNAAQIKDISRKIDSLPDSHQKIFSMLRLSEIIHNYHINAEPDDFDLSYLSFLALNEALQIAKTLNDNKMISYSYGYLGRLYEMNKQYDDAKKMTLKAIFFANQGNFPEILYLWQWQLGRLLVINGEIEKGKKYYKDAISTLDPIRTQFFAGFRNHENIFNSQIKPLYMELTEIFLAEAEFCINNTQKTLLLKQAIKTMELIKSAELQDFYEDECTAKPVLNKTILNRSPENAAIIYPVILQEKISLLLILPDGIKQIQVKIDLKIFNKTIEEYRKLLQTRTNHRFLYYSWQLYDWLIRPIEQILTDQKIETLVFSPDGALRLIPLSTLHDGKKFLIEKYAIAIIPAINLTEFTQHFQKNNINILINGLSEARHGFSPLPSVAAEVTDIQRIFNGKSILKNENYTLKNLKNKFENNNYNIVHIATHGIFGGNTKNSFLLTYDDKLTMNQLENLIGFSKFRNHKVDILTLSACQTALGNERAALGLAGVAVKAGVECAVATLWYVDDEATSVAIREFYRQLKNKGISKAKAMQNTQIKLIANPRYWQPLYWAPFLLIGNWM